MLLVGLLDTFVHQLVFADSGHLRDGLGWNLVSRLLGPSSINPPKSSSLRPPLELGFRIGIFLVVSCVRILERLVDPPFLFVFPCGSELREGALRDPSLAIFYQDLILTPLTHLLRDGRVCGRLLFFGLESKGSEPGLKLDSDYERGLISPDLPVEASTGLSQAAVPGGKDILPPVKSSKAKHKLTFSTSNPRSTKCSVEARAEAEARSLLVEEAASASASAHGDGTHSLRQRTRRGVADLAGRTCRRPGRRLGRSSSEAASGVVKRDLGLPRRVDLACGRRRLVEDGHAAGSADSPGRRHRLRRRRRGQGAARRRRAPGGRRETECRENWRFGEREKREKVERDEAFVQKFSLKGGVIPPREPSRQYGGSLGQVSPPRGRDDSMVESLGHPIFSLMG
ncbi:hypothetical protein NL676_039890 [Syzygium grande]|nr:hypothetical protein NL676_039890 [Syzygium grande]